MTLYFTDKKKNKSNFTPIKQNSRAVVVAQLAERSLPISDDPGSNPAIGNFY